MHNLTLEDADDFIDGLDIRGDSIKCPICGRPMQTSENAEGSAFWSHFFSKKHDGLRPLDPSLEDRLRQVIRQTARAAKKAQKAAEAAAKQEEREARIAEAKRRSAKYKVSGAFLDEIVNEMEALISMMEPYYSQAGADADALATIRDIRAISGAPADD